MFKTYQLYIIKLFFKKILLISAIFLTLIIILSIFDEISFFKESENNILLPFFLTLLSAPSTLFEIFPFIFLIATQFFFLEIINKEELEVFKIHGLNNLKIIKILFFSSIITGMIIVSFYYSFSSKFKFLYLDLKNNYSNDNKYLAIVTENGLWIKDEINEKILIINAGKIENQYLKNISITEFDSEFDLVQIIQSSKVDISNKQWVIFSPIISKNNKSINFEENIKINTHFDEKKINSLFSNLSSLNIFQLIKLGNDYETLGYSSLEVKSYLNRLVSFPIYLSLMTILASIIMINIKRNKPLVFHVILGIFISVVIYYIYYLFNLLGKTEKIPLYSSTWLPLLLLTILVIIGLIRINEK